MAETRGIQSGGKVGLAIEPRGGVYRRPTIWIPILSENLSTKEDTIIRRPIADTVDPYGAHPGRESHDGTVEMEFIHSMVPYLMYGARTAIVKSGTSPNFVYTITPTQVGSNPEINRTLSLTIIRNEQVFAFTGVVIGSTSIMTTDGELRASMNVLPSDEVGNTYDNDGRTTAGLLDSDFPVTTIPTNTIFGPGEYIVEIPTGTQVFDTDNISFDINDNAENQYRLQNIRRGPQFIKFGERETKLECERDFFNRDVFDQFKLVQEDSLNVRSIARSNSDRYLEIDVANSIVSMYDVALGGSPGDLIRAKASYMGINPAGSTYTMEIGTSEDIVLADPYPLDLVVADDATAGAADASWTLLEEDWEGRGTTANLSIEIEHSTDRVAWTAVDAGDTTVITEDLTGLTAGTVYFRIRVKDTDKTATALKYWSPVVEVTVT